MASRVNPVTKFDYSHYVCFPDDGRRHEIIGGDHYVNPAPSTYHQTVSRRIQFQLYSQIELTQKGVVYDAPVDLQLGDHDIVQPDLVLVLRERQQIITPTKIKGVPDLVVEILSLTSIENDQTLKRQMYEKAGVREYWIVDPFEHQLNQLVLENGAYLDRPHDAIVQLSVIENVTVDLNSVW
jgi:Uma2 family endonuclease